MKFELITLRVSRLLFETVVVKMLGFMAQHEFEAVGVLNTYLPNPSSAGKNDASIFQSQVRCLNSNPCSQYIHS